MGVLPGKDVLVDNYVSIVHKDAIENDVIGPEDAKEFYVDYYINGTGSEGFDNMISEVEESFESIQKGIDDLTTSATETTASNSVPQTLVVGQATGSPNPAYATIDNAQKKHVMLTTLRFLEEKAGNMKKTCATLKYPLPSSAESLIDGLSTLKDLIDNIPG